MKDNTDERQQFWVDFAVGAIITVGALLGLLGLWLLVTGFLGYQNARSVQSLGTELVERLADGDPNAATELLPEMRDAAASADATFNSVPWSTMASMPLIGESVQVVADVAAGTNAIVGATAGHDDQIQQSLTLLDEQGVAGIAGLEELAPVAEAAEERVAPYVAKLNRVPAGPMLGPVGGIRGQFLDIANGTRSLAGATRALPTMLGAYGERTWLVIVQNTAEARGTGGLIGAYSVVKVKKGEFLPEKAETTNDLFNSQTIPLTGIPKDTQDFWGPGLSKWWGLNLDRNFPFAGLLASRGIAMAGSPVNDVISIDAEAVAGLLEVTGPITSDGVTVDSDNAAYFFTKGIYEEFPDPKTKDAVTIRLTEQLLGAIANKPLDLVKLWNALGPAASSGSVLTYSTDNEIQRNLVKMPTGGQLPTTLGPFAAVAINDFAGNKLSAYLDVAVDYRSASLCRSPGADSTISVTVTNNAPENLPAYVDQRNDTTGGPKGSTLVGVATYAPVDSQLKAATVDGATPSLTTGVNRNHPTWMAELDLLRGESKTFTVEFREPWQPQLPTLSLQPFTNEPTATVSSSC